MTCFARPFRYARFQGLARRLKTTKTNRNGVFARFNKTVQKQATYPCTE